MIGIHKCASEHIWIISTAPRKPVVEGNCDKSTKIMILGLIVNDTCCGAVELWGLPPPERALLSSSGSPSCSAELST